MEQTDMEQDKNIQIDEVSITDAAPNNKNDIDEHENVSDTNPADADTDAIQTADYDAQIDSLTAQVRELNDKYLRMAAELENTRRRAAMDVESAARTRAMNVARNFLPVMDAVDAALKHTPDDDGIKSMARAMAAAFAQIGIVRIDSVGEPLNPQFHNAIQVVDCSNNENPPKSNTVIEEMQTGYMFGDTVLRTAMVVVAK